MIATPKTTTIQWIFQEASEAPMADSDWLGTPMSNDQNLWMVLGGVA